VPWPWATATAAAVHPLSALDWLSGWLWGTAPLASAAGGPIYGRGRGDHWMWPANSVGERLALDWLPPPPSTGGADEEKAEEEEAVAAADPQGGRAQQQQQRRQCEQPEGAAPAPPLQLETLSAGPDAPRVFRVAGFLSPAERAEFRALVAAPALCAGAGKHRAYCQWQPSVISGRESGRAPRTSYTTWVGPIFGTLPVRPWGAFLQKTVGGRGVCGGRGRCMQGARHCTATPAVRPCEGWGARPCDAQGTTARSHPLRATHCWRLWSGEPPPSSGS
jgi:hypothetical protein